MRTRHEDTPTHKHARNKDRPEPHALLRWWSAEARSPGRKEAAQFCQETRWRCIETFRLPREHLKKAVLPC